MPSSSLPAWPHNALLAGIAPDLVAQLAPYLRHQSYAAGEVILEEGAPADCLYLLAAGSVGIFKGTVAARLATVMAGSYFGEMGLFSGEARSTTVQAEEPAEVWSITLDGLRAFEAATGFDLLTHAQHAHLGLLSQRLTHTNEVAADAWRARLAEYQLRIAFGSLAINIILLLFFYISALQVLRELAAGDTSTPTSSAIIVVVTGGAGWIAWRSGLPWATFGLSAHRWRWVLADALGWTLVVCAGFTLLKLVALHTVPRLAAFQLFQPWVSVRGLPYTFGMYAVYALLAPLQEFMTRGVLQGSLARMLAGPGATTWAILSSSAVFSIMHQHLGLGFALAVFPLGVFWGWLYHRQQSLLGVSVSHIIIGLWLTGVLNLPSLVQ